MKMITDVNSPRQPETEPVLTPAGHLVVPATPALPCRFEAFAEEPEEIPVFMPAVTFMSCCNLAHI
jgi:hypothetical protein